MLSREAARKISAVFSQLSSLLYNENRTLAAKVQQLEKDLKSVSEGFDKARMWRESVLNGCPVLFEQSGLIYTLKPFGKLNRKTQCVTEAQPPAGNEAGHKAGELTLKEKDAQN